MNNCAVSAIVVIHGGEVRTSLKRHSQHNKERKEIYNSSTKSYSTSTGTRA